MDGIPVGPGRLGLSHFRDDGSGTNPASRFNVELADIGGNPGGKLHFALTATNGDFTGGKSGPALSVQHDQANVFV